MSNKNHCVGDLVQITDNIHQHEFEIGQIVKITRISSGFYIAAEPDDANPDFMENTAWAIVDAECKPAPITPELDLFDSYQDAKFKEESGL